MMARQAPVTTPVITLHVDDIDATVTAIEKHGGSSIGEKMPVGDMGFAAYFKDSEGNVMGLWQMA
jgi:predicted enzyme related to lactoylglutathione lyase